MATYNETYTLTVSDGVNPDVIQNGTIITKDGTFPSVNLSSLNNGTLTVSITLNPSGETSQFTITKATTP